MSRSAWVALCPLGFLVLPWFFFSIVMVLWMLPVGPDVLPVDRWDGIVCHVLRDDPLDNTRLGPCM